MECKREEKNENAAMEAHKQHTISHTHTKMERDKAPKYNYIIKKWQGYKDYTIGYVPI